MCKISACKLSQKEEIEELKQKLHCIMKTGKQLPTNFNYDFQTDDNHNTIPFNYDYAQTKIDIES